MPNDYCVKRDLPIHYSENNVSQCWSCKNCIGQKEFNTDMIPVLLPECRVTEKYMLFVYEMHCSRYEAIGGKNNAN